MNKQRVIVVLIFPLLMGSALLLSFGASQGVQKKQDNRTTGKNLVQKLCLFCHSEAAVSQERVKPWDQLISDLSQQDFHDQVTTGIPPAMPGYPELTEQQTASIYAFLRQEGEASSHQEAASAEAKGGAPDREGGKISQSGLEKKLSAELRCPCCGKLVKDCSCGMIPDIRAEIGRLEKKGLGEKQIKMALAKRYGNKILPISEISETLSPESFYQVAHAYDAAKQIPQTLERITCFCPCYRVGHASLLDCYKDRHGANCQICVEEALAAKRLVEQGVAEDEIVQTIHERYRPKASPEAGVSAKEIPFPDIPRITKEELKSMLGNPDAVIVDVRGAKQWEASGRKIKGAVWEDPKNVESWADKYPKGKIFVFY
jgi:cytochrome c-type biogenesis protein CcmH/NrfF